LKIFQPLYDKAIAWSRHRFAPAILCGLSFFEAIVFPVMPELMLAPMCVAQPRRGFWFAGMSLFFSMLGAVVGYYLGHYAFEVVKPMFAAIGLLPGIESGIAALQAEMVKSPWAVFSFLVLGGFAPIPMKVFTWASGIVGVPMLPYLASMAVGRGKRVFALALLVRLFGEKAEAMLRKYIEPIGWVAMVLLAGLVAWLLLRGGGA
jgi:membrane protein YqaA with SNARE-associated domain